MEFMWQFIRSSFSDSEPRSRRDAAHLTNFCDDVGATLGPIPMTLWMPLVRRALSGRSFQGPHAAAAPARRRRRPARTILIGVAATAAVAAAAAAAIDPHGARHAAGAAVRCGRTALALARIFADYKWSLRSPPPARSIQGASVVVAAGSVAPNNTSAAIEQLNIHPVTSINKFDNNNKVDDIDDIEEEYQARKSAVHKRSAERLLALFRANGGIFIKLGQHISALVYLLPPEYTETMKVLQDQCPPTSYHDVEKLFRTDMSVEIYDLFEEFDPTPLGVASLAQVHRAVLRPAVASPISSQPPPPPSSETIKLVDVSTASTTSRNRFEVAVKIQHPTLDEYAPIDIHTCAFFVRVVKRLFPDFEFDWLAQEMQQSLPKELDFVQEASNANRVRANFAQSRLLCIPKVFWSKRRILVMEYINGGKVDDLAYLESHGISPEAVSTDLTRAFSEMIFRHGFVHCDPHPGNVFVRPCPDKRSWAHRIISRLWDNARHRRNFEIVLLDHGLYRTLSNTFRLDYAQFWGALIRGDERAIEHYAYRLLLQHDRRRRSSGGIDYHRLFASMVSGRSWETISGGKSHLKSNTSSRTSTARSLMGSGLASVRSRDELTTVQNNAKHGRFLIAMADILSKLPSELLLLLKTNDLLRAVDESLHVSNGTAHLVRMVALMGSECALAVRTGTIQTLSNTRVSQGALLPIWVDAKYWSSWVDYAAMILRLAVMQLLFS